MNPLPIAIVTLPIIAIAIYRSRAGWRTLGSAVLWFFLGGLITAGITFLSGATPEAAGTLTGLMAQIAAAFGAVAHSRKTCKQPGQVVSSAR